MALSQVLTVVDLTELPNHEPLLQGERTPLFRAVTHSRKDVVSMLLDHGADMEAKDRVSSHK